jgi:hypothetical protein
MKMLLRTALFLHMLLVPLTLRAETGVLVGRIVDDSGSGLASVRLVLTGLDGRTIVEATSDVRGEFSLAAPLGEYQLEIRAPGSATVLQRVRVMTGIGHLSLTAARSTLVDTEFLRSLSDDKDEFARSLQGPPEQSSFGNASMPVGLAGPIPVLLGGVDTFVNGEFGRLPPVDQVREVWIAGNPFSAEFRAPGLARMDVMTPDERNTLHGTAAFNFRDESMDAAAPVPGFRSPYQVRYLHGILDGPLYRDKLFSSITAQRRSETTPPIRISATLPTGPFSETIPNVFTEQAFGTRSQYVLSDRHTLGVDLLGASLIKNNVGIGNIVLRERSSTDISRRWDFGVRETARLGDRTFHELRFRVQRDTAETSPDNEGVLISVQDRFQAGGAAFISEDRATTYQLSNVLSWARGEKIFRAGAQIRRVDDFSLDQNTPAGAFSFFTMDLFIAGTPRFYGQSLGALTTSVKETHAALFGQADWRFRRRLSLSTGLRYEYQSRVGDSNNIDPRVGFAFELRPSTTIRGGVGVFHQLFSHAALREVSEHEGRTSIQIENPSYPDPFTAGTLTQFPFSVRLRQAASDLANPYLVNAGISVEKYFASDSSVSVSYDHIRGKHQIRSRNINAPYPGTVSADLRTRLGSGSLQTRTAARAELDAMRPFNPITSSITQYESSGSLETRALSVRFRAGGLRAPGVSFQWTGGYTLGWSDDDNAIPANPYDLRAEWGRSTLFPNHHLWSGLMARVRWGIRGALLLTSRSGFPYSITTRFDENFDGNNNERPAGTARNTETGPHYANVDARLSKTIALPLFSRLDTRPELTVFAYARNLLNSTHFLLPAGNFDAVAFGQPIRASFPRKLEVGGKLSF